MQYIVYWPDPDEGHILFCLCPTIQATSQWYGPHQTRHQKKQRSSGIPGTPAMPAFVDEICGLKNGLFIYNAHLLVEKGLLMHDWLM
jgi:hypothetical protein